MNPAWSVIFFTTLAGAGQGLFLALFGLDIAGMAQRPLLVVGAVLSVGLAGGGLVASFFHLGHPERAWRSAAMWRSSWLSREVIVLPVFIAGVVAWGGLHALQAGPVRAVGAATALLCGLLFLCTAMIYASIRFLQEWASPLTLANYLLLGCASGTTLAAALAAGLQPDAAAALLPWALGLTLAGAATRAASLWRNARLKPRSTLQTAIGIRHPRITQRAMGFGGGSFNTREFFHGRSPALMRSVRWWFPLLAFVLPAFLLATAPALPAWLGAAFVVQYLGLLAERWFFFAQANHPQNLYYQVVS